MAMCYKLGFQLARLAWHCAVPERTLAAAYSCATADFVGAVLRGRLNLRYGELGAEYAACE